MDQPALPFRGVVAFSQAARLQSLGNQLKYPHLQSRSGNRGKRESEGRNSKFRIARGSPFAATRRSIPHSCIPVLTTSNKVDRDLCLTKCDSHAYMQVITCAWPLTVSEEPLPTKLTEIFVYLTKCDSHAYMQVVTCAWPLDDVRGRTRVLYHIAITHTQKQTRTPMPRNATQPR